MNKKQKTGNGKRLSERAALHQQVDTLPDLVDWMVDTLIRVIHAVLPKPLCESVRRVFVTGCGDSFHAPLNAELAFEQLGGLPCEPMTAMQFSRYAAPFLPEKGSLVLGVSVSGQVSRTAEALALARKAGAMTVAITGNAHGTLAQAAEVVLKTAVPPLPDELQGMIVPGTRSYIASQLALYLTAVHLGEMRGHLTKTNANKLRHELAGAADLMAQTIALSDAAAQKAAQEWLDADRFVYCGAGPNYGTALFSAAKMIEACGDTAVPQDIEEWAHLQYFEKQVDTPTFLISAGGRDADRTLEIAEAAKTIGRRVALIAPLESELVKTATSTALSTAVFDTHFPIATPIRECFSPLLTCLPGTLFAAYRAQLLNEPYFRGFSGGRSAEDGGGISRIRTSQRIDRE